MQRNSIKKPCNERCHPISYYEHLHITHLFDTMHIRKNVTETLWWLLELRREKDKFVKACKDIQERNHAMKYIIQFHSNEEQVNIKSIPWMFTKQQRNVFKEAMRKIKFPTRFCVNLKNIITKKGDFAGVKTHDRHVFIKVIIIVMSI